MKFRRLFYTGEFFAGVLLMFLIMSSQCIAQVAAGGVLPEALKDVKPTANACRLDQPAASSELSTPVAVSPDMQCAISISEALRLLETPDATLVDLRLPVDYQAFHINGATNLAAVDLHSKPYWRKKSLVLMGNGKAETELYRECRRLKQIGYKHVRVLQGGMLAWLTQGQPVSGRSSSVTQLSRLSAAELWAEIQSTDVLILLDPAQAALQKELPDSRVLLKTTEVTFQGALERSKKQRMNASFAAVILAAPPTISYDQIQRLQRAAAPAPLLIYSDTRDAFKREVAAQKAIWTAQARGPKLPGCGL